MRSLPALSTPVFRRLTHAVFLAAGMLMLAGGPVHAAEPAAPDAGGLTLQATGSETGYWSSNPLMVLQGAKSLYGSITSPELILSGITPTTRFNVDAVVNKNVFDQSTFDSTDLHLKAGISKQMQQWGWGLQEQTDYDTTRTSELTTFGTTTSPVRRLGLGLTPQISFKPAATDKLALSGSVTTAMYEKSTFTNYVIFSVNPTYTHDFDPLNSSVFGIQAQRYKATSSARTTTDTIGPSIGWAAKLTPRLTARANVGVQGARQFGAGVASSKWTLQYTFSGGIVFKGQQDIVDFGLSRAQYPFGNGTEALLTTFTIKEAHTLNPRLLLNLGGSYQSGTYQTAANGNLDSLISANSGLTFHATDHLDVTATYQYRYETLTGASGNAQDNTVTLGVVYRPQAWGL